MSGRQQNWDRTKRKQREAQAVWDHCDWIVEIGLGMGKTFCGKMATHREEGIHYCPEHWAMKNKEKHQ